MVRRTSALTLIAALLSIQTCQASIVVFAFGNKKAIIAADSRATYGDGSYRDDSCKIGSYKNNVVFAHVGIASFRMVDFMAEARQAVADVTSQPRLPGDNRSIAERSAILWKDRAVTALQALGLQQLSALINQNGNPELSAFMFSSVDEGTQTISTWYTTVTFAGTPFGIPMLDGKVEQYGVDSDDAIKLRALGHAQIFWEYFVGRTERAMSWRKQTQSSQSPPERRLEETVAALVEFTVQNDSQGVGGDVDEVDLEVNQGIRWLRRKAACASPGEEPVAPIDEPR